jgi:S-DNA-T family DNA segregation ATPase FtsK/SpoIIIE
MKLSIIPKETNDIKINLARKLHGLGIGVREIKDGIVGPMVTAYPILLDSSTPLSKLMHRAEDLALAVDVDSVDLRRVGREVHVYIPNKNKTIVNFQEAAWWMANNEEAKACGIPILLGMDYTGNKSFLDLTKQPHILIAGSTGSGKSVFEVGLATALSLAKSTKELKMILVDTKLVELTLLKSLPHVQNVITNPIDYYEMITELQAEVSKRMKLFAHCGIRNIAEYNTSAEEQYKLPFILLMIDELADLIDKDKEVRSEIGKQHAEPKVMDSLRKLLRVSRAAGVHVIAGTQRVSGDIIAPEAKTNFPARISLKLPSSRDSEFILDEKGAENLLGNGDMLVKENGVDIIKRFHAPFIELADIKYVIDNLTLAKSTLQLEV